jgi:hypothetical protein
MFRNNTIEASPEPPAAKKKKKKKSSTKKKEATSKSAAKASVGYTTQDVDTKEADLSMAIMGGGASRNAMQVRSFDCMHDAFCIMMYSFH